MDSRYRNKNFVSKGELKALKKDQQLVKLSLKQNAAQTLLLPPAKHPRISDADGWVAEFEKLVPQAPKEIPDEDELGKLIEEYKSLEGHESVTLEVKATLRVDPGKCWQHEGNGKLIGDKQFSKLKKADKIPYLRINGDLSQTKKSAPHSCIRAISALMNTHGGALIIGIDDKTREIHGIEIDKFHNEGSSQFSDDRAIEFLHNMIEQSMEHKEDGNWVTNLIEARVIKVNEKPVMYVNVPRWNHPSRDPPKIKLRVRRVSEDKKWFSKSRPKYHDIGEPYFIIRKGNGSKILEGEDIQKHIETYFGEEPKTLDLERVVRTGKVSGFTASDGKEPTMKAVLEGEIYPSSTLKIDYLEAGHKWPDHLKGPKQRANQLSKVVQNIIFSRIRYSGDPSAAIQHFMKTNDASTMEALTAYDMASAYTQMIIKPDDEEFFEEEKKKIKEYWEELSQRIYIATNKDANIVSRFFYYYLMASEKWKRPSARWEEKHSWAGLKKEILKMCNTDGSPNYTKLVSLYEEMRDYSIPFAAAVNPDQYEWPNLAANRDERTYLKILSSANVRQHVPVYMAINQACKKLKQAKQKEIVIGFLKNWVYLHTRYSLLTKLIKEGSKAPYTTGEFHKRISGMKGWISASIHDNIRKNGADLSSEEENLIMSLPLTIEREMNLGDAHPWEKNHPVWKNLGVGQKPQLDVVRLILLTYERAVLGAGNSTVAHIHGDPDYDIEHILPKSAEEWGYPWYVGDKETPTHEKWINALGNHVLLEDTRNRHVGNNKFGNKIPTGGCKPSCILGKENLHYQGTNFESAQNIVEHWKAGEKWTAQAIGAHSTILMNKLVEFLEAPDYSEEE